jgi:thymidylate synthase (FAD)
MEHDLKYSKPHSWLVVIPQPAEEFENSFYSVLELLAYCARVSNPANQFNNETADGLIKYLIDHKHWSPLEMASITIGVDTTRDIARQMLRHRSFKFQEFSQRYSDPEEMETSFVLREARMQDPKNRQNSLDTATDEIKHAWAVKQTQIIHEARLAYRWAIDNGIAKEQARCVLPEGNTKSKLFMSGDIRSWIHYIELRSGNGTQQEHIEIARCIAEAITKIFPMIKERVQP